MHHTGVAIHDRNDRALLPYHLQDQHRPFFVLANRSGLFVHLVNQFIEFVSPPIAVVFGKRARFLGCLNSIPGIAADIPQSNPRLLDHLANNFCQFSAAVFGQCWQDNPHDGPVIDGIDAQVARSNSGFNRT